MAKEQKVRSENLSLRLDPKTKFVIEFMARLKGQTMTTVVERAIVEAAEQATIHDYNDSRTWDHYWHVNEGVRTINVIKEKKLFPTFEEEYLLSFIRTHAPFFYADPSELQFPLVWAFEILWPRIQEFLQLWTNTKSSDYFAAGQAMNAAIQGAGLEPIEWPVKKRVSKKSDDDLDGEIPF